MPRNRRKLQVGLANGKSAGNAPLTVPVYACLTNMIGVGRALRRLVRLGVSSVNGMIPRLFPPFLISCVVVLAGSAHAQTTDDSATLRPEQSSQERPVLRGAVRPTGGLPTLPEEALPGARYQTASEQRARLLAAEEEERLLAVRPADETLVTGSVDGDEESRRASSSLEADPYAPLGIRTGPLTWFPAIDLAVGYDSNVDNSSIDAREVRTVRLSPELRVQSDWRQHAWTGSMRGSLEYIDDGRDLGHTLEIENELRLDLGLETSVTLRGGYELTGEAVSDPDAVAGADGTTDTHDLTAEVGATRRVGALDATAGIEASRVQFSDTPLAGGGIQSNDDRNRYDGELTLRLARAEGPVFQPFVEAAASMRRFDERIDRNGFERNSFGYGLRGGLTIADDGPLRGEASVGLVGERFEDDGLDDVLAVSATASLTWDVTTLTSVTLDLDTSVDPTTQAGSGAGVSRTASLGLSHDLRRNLELRLGAAIEDTRFSGIDSKTRTYTGSAGLTWRVSPVAAFRLDTRYEHEPDSSGDVDRFTVEAGITLRR